MYLFDTDVITNPLKPKPSSHLLSRLSALEHSQQHITTVTLGEIVFGAHRSSRPSYHLQRLRDLVLSQVTLRPF